jgi:hypothetical protein
VNKEIYIDILHHLRDAVRRKRPQKWKTSSWFLLHNNAPAHQSLVVTVSLAMSNVTTLQHPPNSPDMDPTDFYLFPQLKSALKGWRFMMLLISLGK